MFVKNRKTNFLLKGAFFVVFLVSLTRVHLRVQTTMIGYELGKLKDSESHLLERRSFLKTELAKLTTKNNLSLLADSKDNFTKNIGSFASK